MCHVCKTGGSRHETSGEGRAVGMMRRKSAQRPGRGGKRVQARTGAGLSERWQVQTPRTDALGGERRGQLPFTAIIRGFKSRHGVVIGLRKEHCIHKL